MLRMMERNITVEVKEENMKTAESVFRNCESEFKSIMEKETGKIMETKLTMSEYSLEEENKNIIGGIFLRSSDGVIVCDNSLDSRVSLIFEQLLPTIRGWLFPKPQKVEEK